MDRLAVRALIGFAQRDNNGDDNPGHRMFRAHFRVVTALPPSNQAETNFPQNRPRKIIF